MDEHTQSQTPSPSPFWRYAVIFWTTALFLLIIKDVFSGGAFDAILGPVAAIYTACLAIYSAEKEFERWQHHSIGRHPGEIYVALWTILILGIFIGQYFGYIRYQIAPEIVSTYIVVLGILAITKKSKTRFQEKSGE